MTSREAIIKHYQAVQQSNAVLQPCNATSKDRRADVGERYYSSGTPAERYWNNMGPENNKRQNISSLLHTIFPDGLAPLANKVAKIERKEQARAAKAAAATAAVSQPEAESGAESACSPADYVTDHVTGIVTSKSSVPLSTKAGDRSRSAAAPKTPASRDHAGLIQQRTSRSPVPATDTAFAASMRNTGMASSTGRRTDAGSPKSNAGYAQHHKHYSHGQKLAASIMWETASGKSQAVRLRQCLTYSEIQMKNRACAEVAQSPLARLELQEAAFRVAQEV